MESNRLGDHALAPPGVPFQSVTSGGPSPIYRFVELYTHWPVAGGRCRLRRLLASVRRNTDADSAVGRMDGRRPRTRTKPRSRWFPLSPPWLNRHGSSAGRLIRPAFRNCPVRQLRVAGAEADQSGRGHGAHQAACRTQLGVRWDHPVSGCPRRRRRWLTVVRSWSTSA